MKFFLATVLISGFLFSSISMEVSAQSFDLDDHKWKDRVLLVFSPNTYNFDYRKQVKALNKSRDGINERDLKIYHILQETSTSVKGEIIEDDDADYLLSDFGVSSSDFTVILVGKDGTEKLRTNEFLQTDDLFDEIDAMPMRKLEMKDDGK
jgi:hypothetical protein